MTVFSIGLHNQSRIKEMLPRITDWLVGEVTISRFPEDLNSLENAEYNWRKTYEAIRGENWPDCNHWDFWNNLPRAVKEECSQVFNFDPVKYANQLQNYRLTDSQGVCVDIYWENNFHQGALIVDDISKKFRLHNSDPVKAHTICHSKTCHHFDSGKLYKCGQVALFPQFYQQFFVDLTDQEYETMHSYVPGSIDMSSEDLTNWTNQLNNPIPQCQFCPESYDIKEIFADNKKVVFLKRKNKK
jgi:hypothetical protein